MLVTKNCYVPFINWYNNLSLVIDKFFCQSTNARENCESSHPEVFPGKGVLKICSKFSKFTGEHPCRSAISITLLCNFIEIAFRHGCSLVNLLHIFRTPFLKNSSGRLLLLISINCHKAIRNPTVLKFKHSFSSKYFAFF